jgi:carboxyl-terminal processing protease
MFQIRLRTRAFVFAATVVVVSCGFGAACYGQSPAVVHADAKSAPAIDLQELYDTVVDVVTRRFVDEPRLRKVDWPSRARAMRGSVLAAGSAEEAARRINALLAELDTSHTGLYTPDEYRYYITLDVLRDVPGVAGLVSEKFWSTGPYFPGIGAFTTRMGDGHFIDGILEGSPADKAGLKLGDEILSVDGQAYTPIAAFRGKIGTTVELEVRRRCDLAPTRYNVPVVPVLPSAAFAAATKASARIIEKNGRQLGYIHVWSTNEAGSFKAALAALNPAYATVISAFTALGGAPSNLDGLIVDMRGRVGGNIGVADQLLDMLGTAPKPYWGQRRSIGRSTTQESPAGGSYVMSGLIGSQARPFQGRSAILVDHHTRSAAEIMAYGYKRSGFGTVIGTPTAGAVSGGMPHVMPGDLLLYVAETSDTFDGKPLEGAGVAPDIRVERPLPYAAGADPVLEAAVEQLARRAE